MASGAAASVLLSVAACRTAESDGGGIQLSQTEGAVMHAVHNDRLRAMMREIKLFAVERLPQEMDGRGPVARQMEEIDRTARALADDAARLPSFLSGEHWNELERQTFERYATQLREQSLELAALARKHDRRGLRRQLQAMSTTCNGCHRAFRELPG